MENINNNFYIKQLNKDFNIDKINYNLIYDPLKMFKLNENVFHITKLALQNTNLRKYIDYKIIKIYEQIRINSKLKKYLKFLNLINNDGIPIFINESDEVLLSNKIKIILITLF